VKIGIIAPQSGPSSLTQDKSALHFQVLCRSFALVRHLFVFDNLPLIEAAEAGALYRRDMNEDVFAAALRLDESIALRRIEPLYGTCRHLGCSNRITAEKAI
jgi:hypothetical protein